MSGKLTLNGKAYVLVDRFNFTCALAIAVIAFGLGLYGYRARRCHRPGWPPHHGIGMGGSYIALLTGFYVDNGPFLPLWKELPHVTYWLLPSIVGVPLIWFALHRYRPNNRQHSS
jgi:hypothetical protein